MARDIYLALKDDASAEAKIRCERQDLALKIATDSNASFQLTSSTINGKSMAGSHSITNSERLRILGIIVTMFDKGGAISSKSTPSF